jgi:hypothetical protein
VNIPEQDAAYLFVKDIFFNLKENWHQIRCWIEEPCSPVASEDTDYPDPIRIDLDEREACHQFSLAVLSLEIAAIPSPLMEERGKDIIAGIFSELQTLDAIEGNPCDHLEKVENYLSLLGFFSDCPDPDISREKMLYYFYRNMAIRNKNGWADIFLSSKLNDLLTACMEEHWKVFSRESAIRNEDPSS